MAAELSALSFLSIICLVVFIPVRRVRNSVSLLAIVLWLVAINLIRGINALVWDGNVDIRASVWCDIATKIVLASNIAIPAAFVCISYRLECLASWRAISVDGNIIRKKWLLEVFLCYGIPVIYAALHPISQDHRFDLAKDYGCSPSIHNSSPALTFIWIPPLILCIITFVLACFTIHHVFRVSYPQFVVHIESRATLTSSIFFRQLSITFVMASAMIISITFFVFSTPTLVPWSSWAAVHSQMRKIKIVTNVDDLDMKRLSWWFFFSLTALYILLLFTLGEEARDLFRWTVSQLRKKRSLPKFQLPLFHSRSRGDSVGASTCVSVPKSPSPSTIGFKSGWDEMLDEKTSKWGLLPGMLTASSPPPSPTASQRSSKTDEDKEFMAATLSYLGSPTAKTLGFASTLGVRLPGPPPPRLTISPPPESDSVTPSFPSPLPPVYAGEVWTRSIRTDVPPESLDLPSPLPASVVVQNDAPPENMSSVSSVLGAPWPVPPPATSLAFTTTKPLILTTKTQTCSVPRSYSPEDGQHVVTFFDRRPMSIGSGARDMLSVSPPKVTKPLKSALKRPRVVT